MSETAPAASDPNKPAIATSPVVEPCVKATMLLAGVEMLGPSSSIRRIVPRSTALLVAGSVSLSATDLVAVSAPAKKVAAERPDTSGSSVSL